MLQLNANTWSRHVAPNDLDDRQNTTKSITPLDQRISQAVVAIPGLGGVGGSHLHALAALGVRRFHLADFDTFEEANLNRQWGANQKTLGRPKAEVMAEMAQQLHANAEVKTFPDGIHEENIAAFLDGVTVVVDGLEFFAIEVRRMLYQQCQLRKIPVIHAGPLGYGAALFVFLPDGPSFDEHFSIQDGMTHAEMLTAHILGHATAAAGDVDPRHVDIQARRGPGLASACVLCSAVAAEETRKIVLGEPTKAASPNGIYYDPYRLKTSVLKKRRGMMGLRGKVLRWLAFRRFPALRVMHEEELRS